jgi:gas vesicle protein
MRLEIGGGMMGRMLRFAGGLLVGAVAGAVVVLLFAPQSGSETRQAFQARVQEILDEGRKAAEDRRLELTAQFEARKQPVSRE